MRQVLQCFVSQARLRIHDAAGQNPILLIDITTGVSGCNIGDRVLITSAGFADFLDSPIAADFTLTNLIPESYLAAGSVTCNGYTSGGVSVGLRWQQRPEQRR